MTQGYVRAKSRAMVAALSTGLVVVPVTGVVAMTLVSQEPLPEGADPDLVSAIYADYSAAMAESSRVVTASTVAEYSISVPDIDVEIIPPPPPPRATTTRSSSSGARTVANSKDVKAAISGSSVIAEASKYVGVPYKSGGTSPKGFDCSGFVQYVYKQLGIDLPRTSGSIANAGTRVSKPKAGDIIYTPGHVGIYAGPNLQIDAPTSGGSIQFRAIWQKNPTYIRIS